MLPRTTQQTVHWDIQPVLASLRQGGIGQDDVADALAEAIAHAIVIGAQTVAPAFGVELAALVRTRLITAEQRRAALGLPPRGRLPDARIGFASDAARLCLRCVEARITKFGPAGLQALCASMADELAARAGDETGAVGLVRTIERWRRVIEASSADPDARDPAVPTHLH